MTDENSTEENRTIRVELDYDPASGALKMSAPQNTHYALGVMRLAEAQILFGMAERTEAQRAAQHDPNKIRVVKDLPDSLKGSH